MTITSKELQENLRSVTAEKLEHLQAEAASSDSPSWINGTCYSDGADDRSSQCRFFDHTGFIHVPAFADTTTVAKLKEEMTNLVETNWHPQEHGLESFGTGSAHNVARGDYFLESSDKVHFFAEPDALDEEEKLKPEYCAPGASKKMTALNKAGHALHLDPKSTFHEYCVSKKLAALVADLGWKDPVVPQSMYIFKQASTGGAVNSHQDSTFLYTTPRQTCLGLWLAVDEATLANGCLWVRPKSHHEGTRRHYQRNVKHFGADALASRSNKADGDPLVPKFVMHENAETDRDNNEVPWDGELPKNGPQGLLDAGFIPVECRAGDLLAFCGELDHLSLPNTSETARHTFQLHLVEGPSQGIEWSRYNWLQYPHDKPFLRLLAPPDSACADKDTHGVHVVK